jgi:hypothetical protein
MNYTVKLLLFTFTVNILVFCWNVYIPIEYTCNLGYFIVAWFFLFSIISHFILTKSLNSENKNAFTMRFMAVSALKLFLSLIIIIIYAFRNKAGMIPFAILFILNYFLFTAFEIISLLKKIKSK